MPSTHRVKWATGERHVYLPSSDPSWAHSQASTPPQFKRKKEILSNWIKMLVNMTLENVAEFLNKLASQNKSTTAHTFLVAGAVLQLMMQWLDEKHQKIEKALGIQLSGESYQSIRMMSMDLAMKESEIVNTLSNGIQKKGLLFTLKRTAKRIAQSMADGIEAGYTEIYMKQKSSSRS